MPRITLDQFKDGLRSLPGTKLLTLRSRIDPFDNSKMYLCDPSDRKVRNPYRGRVFYVVTANGSIGADYEAAANRARALAGWDTDFVEGPRSWGEYVDRNFVYYATKDRWYIRFIQRSRKERWYLDGRVVPRDTFRAWFKPEPDEQVTYRNFAIDKFLFIRYRGETYRFFAREDEHAMV